MGKTPLEIASRAYVNAGSEYHGKPNKTIYDAFSDRDQLEADDAMEEALLALANCTLSDDIINKGIDTYDEVATTPAKLHEGFAAAFRAMLRSMCHADTEQAEKSVSPSALQTGSGREAEAFAETYAKMSPFEQKVWRALSLHFQLKDFGSEVIDEDGELVFQTNNKQLAAFDEASIKAKDAVMDVFNAAYPQAGLKSEATPSAPQADCLHDTNRSIATNNREAE